MFSRFAGVALLVTSVVAGAEIPAPPGQIVDIGTTKLHLNCTGAGSPAVVLESGFPGSSLDWSLVQPVTARFTRVCSYDRAGFGWSEAGKAPRSSQQIAEDLATLLSRANVTAPYVLVGHSLGGLYVRAFASKFPERVAGMVLVDSTHEDQWDFEPKRFWEPTGTPQLRYLQPEVERPKAVEELLRQMWATERWKLGERAEREAIGLSVAEAQKASKRLPAIPLIVLSPGVETTWLDRASMGALKAQQLQREMAAFSPLGRWRPVPGANHYIHLSQPAAVVEAMREMIQAVRELRSVKNPEAAQQP